MSSGFYDMTDAYEELSGRIEWLSQEWYRLDEKYYLPCGCWDDDWSRDDYYEHRKVCGHNPKIYLEKYYIGLMLDKLEELKKIMFDNGQRRKLALLALVMKRRK